MDFAMGWNRFNLTLLGVWPEPRKVSKKTRFKSNAIFWFTTSMTFACICAPQTADLILKSSSLDEVIEHLSISAPVTFALIKQIVLRYHRRALTLLLGQIFDDWTEPIAARDREIMLKNAKLSRTISIVYSVLTYIMISAFVSLQIWNNIQNTSEIDLEGLIHPGSFPYDTKRSPNFELTWLGQLFGSLLTGICYSSFDTLLAALVLHLCGQLTVLRAALDDLVNVAKENNSDTFRQQLGYIVRRHDQLSRFSVTVENCFNLTLLVQTVICASMFCLSGYRMITLLNQAQRDVPIVGMIFFIVHLIYAMLHLFIYCYVGEVLLEQSTGMAESTYDCKWYNLPPKQAVSLVILICRARASFQITAGKFSPFSLELFNAVLKTSAGYLSVLLAMKDRLIEEK